MKRSYKILAKTLLAVSVLLAVAACATDDPNKRAKTGAGIGAVVGAILGHQIDDDHNSSKVVGAVAGAIIGGAVGGYMDKQQKEFEEALAEEEAQNAIEIERLKDDTLKLSLNSEVSFDFGKDDVKTSFYPTLDKLSDVINKYDRTVVHVVGHTDNVGSDGFNQRLSERRSQSVVDYMIDRSVQGARLRTEGRGENEPRESNASEAGRALNRRVEIFLKPIVEGEEKQAYDSPDYS
ncbi:MAG: OmpA family protein [Gammaproteobacteria bacterium]|nr:OmpA family protein [Gammaproteobacteria bacterium]